MNRYGQCSFIMTCVGFQLFMVSINQHGLEVARRCYSGEEVEKTLQNTRGGVTGQKKQYEQKRSRSFKLHWTTDRPWLHYDEHEQMMYCTYGTVKNSLRTKLGLGSKNIFGLVTLESHWPRCLVVKKVFGEHCAIVSSTF